MTRIALVLFALAYSSMTVQAAMSNPGNGASGNGNANAGQNQNSDGGNGEVRKPKKKGKKNQQDYLIIKLQDVLISN